MTDAKASIPESGSTFFHLDAVAAMPLPEMLASLRTVLPVSRDQENLLTAACQQGVDPRLGLLDVWRRLPAKARPALQGGLLASLARGAIRMPGLLVTLLFLARGYDRLSGRRGLRQSQLMLRRQDEGLAQLREQIGDMLRTQSDQIAIQSGRILALEQSLSALGEAGESLRDELRANTSAARTDALAFQSDLLRRIEQMLFDAEQAIDAVAAGLVSHEAGLVYTQALGILPERLEAPMPENAAASAAKQP